MQQREIELAKLVHASEANAVRKWDDSDIRPLKENIKRFGLLVPLLVIPFAGPEGLEADKFEVIDGNRRLRALREIHGLEGAQTTTVPCLVAMDAGTAEGLSANVMRQAMNPMDQYEVFAKLVAEGTKPKEIAKLFDLSVRRVTQVLALAALAPSLRDLLREGKMSWDSGQALTLTMDHAVQEKLFRDHGDKHWNLRGALEEDAPDLGMAIFEKERYFVEGGHLLTDLFAEGIEAETELCADGKIFWKLQHEAIEEALDGFRNQGWKAVMEDGEAGPTWGRHNWPKRSEIKSKKKRKLHSVIYSIREDGKFEVWSRACCCRSTS
jgi:ParB family chromosome partitioning protein